MTDTLIDIYNNILIYDNIQIIVIIDDNNIPWFSGVNIASILGYKNTRQSIITHVTKHDRTSYGNLKKFVKNIPKNAQPHSIYINESGLYSLILSSQKPIAKQFKQWVTEKVLPSIRKTGSYQIEEKYKGELDKLNNKFKQAKKEIRILKHNQKKKNYKATGLIYVIRPIDTNKKNLLKPGKTTNFNKRLNTYNTSLSDDVEILFSLEVNDPDAVEHCMKGLLHKFVYRKNKEYYECTLKKFREIIFKCDKLVQNEYYCENCNSRVSIDHFNDEHHIDDNDELFLDLVIDSNQEGGNNEELLNIPIINPLIFEKYCQVHLYPYIDHNKTYYVCPLNKIKLLLTNCKENDLIDDQINDLINNHDLNDSDTILIDVPLTEQFGGFKHIPADDFNKQIVVMDGGGFILPNGVVVYPNGKVVEPNDKIQHDYQTGGSDWLKNNIYNSTTHKFIN